MQPAAWFEADRPVRSSWVWGVTHLRQAVAIADATVGKGRLLLSGPEVAFRAHPRASLELLFNGLMPGAAEDVALPARRR